MAEIIHSFILETYIAPLQETTTQRRSQPSHGQKKKLYIIYSFSTSPHSCYRTTMLNTKVLNFTVSKEKLKNYVRTLSYFHHSFIHSFGHFYSAHSSPLLLRGAPDYSTDTVSEFHAEAHRQL